MDCEIPKLITVSELQKHFGCGRNVAYELVHRKDFPSFKIGGKYMVIENKIPEWIERQSKKSAK